MQKFKRMMEEDDVNTFIPRLSPQFFFFFGSLKQGLLI